MYESLRKKERAPRRDWMLPSSVAAVAVLLILLAVPLGYAGRLMYRHHVYLQELAGSFVYGEDHSSIVLHEGEGSTRVSKSRASALYRMIADAGAGHPRKEQTDMSGVLLDFGDGTSLRISPSPYPKTEDGVLLNYRNAEGEAYIYDTDALLYEDVIESLP